MRAPSIFALALGSALVACGGSTTTSRTLGTSTAGSGGSTHTASALPFETIERGGQSGIDTQSVELVTDDAAWQTLWALHAGIFFPTPPAPAIDFARDAVLAVFQGPRPVLGYSVEVVRVERDAQGDLEVLERHFAPGSWRIGATALSFAFHMVKIERPAAGVSVGVVRQDLLDAEVYDAGADSELGLNDPNYAGEVIVLRDAAEMSAFWLQHRPTHRPPGFDFQRESLICIMGGHRGSFGHSIETFALVHDLTGDEVRADFVVHPYRGGAAPPQVTESPYQILRVDRIAAPSARAELRQPLPIVERASGQQAIYQGTEDAVLVRDQASLDAVVAARLGAGALAGQPAVDFTRDQVVIAFLGARATGGHGIIVARAELLEDGELDVMVHTNAALGGGTASPSSAFHLVTIPRTAGPFRARFEDVTPRP